MVKSHCIKHLSLSLELLKTGCQWQNSYFRVIWSKILLFSIKGKKPYYSLSAALMKMHGRILCECKMLRDIREQSIRMPTVMGTACGQLIVYHNTVSNFQISHWHLISFYKIQHYITEETKVYKVEYVYVLPNDTNIPYKQC